jgi:hypothetical protein
VIHVLLYAYFGMVFAWCAQGRLRADGIWAQPTISIVAVFIGVIVAPTTLYLNVVYPDWSWLYAIDARSWPALAIIPVLAISAGAVLGGYYGAARLIRSDRGKWVLGGVAGGALFMALIVILASGRLFIYGSAADFRASPRRTIPLSGDKFVLIALVAVTIGVLASAAYVAWELWKDGKRAAAR